MSDERPIWQIPEKFNEIGKKPIKHNFPWVRLEKGECFPVSLNEMKLTTLRSVASIKGKELGRKFKVVRYEEYYLVGRLS